MIDSRVRVLSESPTPGLFDIEQTLHRNGFIKTKQYFGIDGGRCVGGVTVLIDFLSFAFHQVVAPDSTGTPGFDVNVTQGRYWVCNVMIRSTDDD